MVDGALVESRVPNEVQQEEGRIEAGSPVKVFVGGLSWGTTEDVLRAYFSEFGTIIDATLMRDKYTGQPRGFAFIKFEELSAVEKVLSHTHHTLDGRNIDVKRAVPRSEVLRLSLPRFPTIARSSSEATKVFVGGLPPHIEAGEFRAYFERFGCVLDAVVMFDRQTQRSRGFGFVTFETEAEVQQVLKATHEIGGKAVEVKRAEPKAGRWSTDYSGGYNGGGYYNNHGYGRTYHGSAGSGYTIGYGGRRATIPPGGGSGPRLGGGDSPAAYGIYGAYTNGAAYYGYGAYPNYAAAFGYDNGFGGVNAASFAAAAAAGAFGGATSPTGGLSPTGGMPVAGASDGNGPPPPPPHQYMGFPVALANGGGGPYLPPGAIPSIVPVSGPPPTSSSPAGGDPSIPATMYQSVDYGAMLEGPQQALRAGPSLQQQQQPRMARDARVLAGYARTHANALLY